MYTCLSSYCTFSHLISACRVCVCVEVFIRAEVRGVQRTVTGGENKSHHSSQFTGGPGKPPASKLMPCSTLLHNVFKIMIKMKWPVFMYVYLMCFLSCYFLVSVNTLLLCIRFFTQDTLYYHLKCF